MNSNVPPPSRQDLEAKIVELEQTVQRLEFEKRLAIKVGEQKAGYWQGEYRRERKERQQDREFYHCWIQGLETDNRIGNEYQDILIQQVATLNSGLPPAFREPIPDAPEKDANQGVELSR